MKHIWIRIWLVVVLMGSGAAMAVSGGLYSGGGKGEAAGYVLQRGVIGGAFHSVAVQTANYRLTRGFGLPTAQHQQVGDFDGDGLVDFTDFLVFAAGFGRRLGEEGFDWRLDLNRDDAVDFADFLAFASAFGQ